MHDRDRGRRRSSVGAIYHSHTRSEPYPSQTDINFAANWPGALWLIVGARRRGARRPRAAGSRTAQVDARSSSSWMRATRRPLVCPRCGDAASGATSASARDCGMPLVLRRRPRARRSRSPPRTSARARSSRSTPRASSCGSPAARNQAEAELHPGPAARGGRSRACCAARGGFDVPDFLAAGPRDVLVPALRRATPRARCCCRPTCCASGPPVRAADRRRRARPGAHRACVVARARRADRLARHRVPGLGSPGVEPRARLGRLHGLGQRGDVVGAVVPSVVV